MEAPYETVDTIDANGGMINYYYSVERITNEEIEISQ